jgi:hypothetical protein
MYIDIYEGIMGFEHVLNRGYFIHPENLPLPRRGDFISLKMDKEIPATYEIDSILFDYEDKSISFFVHKIK